MCRHEPQWETDISLLGTKELRDFQGRLLRDYRNLKRSVCAQKEPADRLSLQADAKGYLPRGLLLQKTADSMLSLTDNAVLTLAQLDMTLQSYDSQMEKLAVDIFPLWRRERSRIHRAAGEYCKTCTAIWDRLTAIQPSPFGKSRSRC